MVMSSNGGKQDGGIGGMEMEKEEGSWGDVVMNWPRDERRGAKIC